jgi:hypothetical protein
MEKLPSILAKIDLTSTGTSQRWTIGKPGDPISGAIYLPKDVLLPTEITIGFLAGSARHEKMKEVKE